MGGTFPSNNQIAKHLKGDGWAMGWNLGTLLELSEATRIGLSYRHDVTLKLSGDAIGIDQNGQPFTDTGSLDLPLPATAELALFHQLTPALALHSSINWTNWSKFVQLESELDHHGVSAHQGRALGRQLALRAGPDLPAGTAMAAALRSCL